MQKAIYKKPRLNHVLYIIFSRMGSPGVKRCRHGTHGRERLISCRFRSAGQASKRNPDCPGYPLTARNCGWRRIDGKGGSPRELSRLRNAVPAGDGAAAVVRATVAAAVTPIPYVFRLWYGVKCSLKPAARSGACRRLGRMCAGWRTRVSPCRCAKRLPGG